MQVVRLRFAPASPTALVFDSLMQLGPFAQWTMDCKLSRHAEDHQGSNQDSWSAMLDIGFSDNSVETHALRMQSGKMVSSAAYYQLLVSTPVYTVLVQATVCMSWVCS